MSKYLARLRALDSEKRPVTSPSKPSKAPFEPFEGGETGRFQESGLPPTEGVAPAAPLEMQLPDPAQRQADASRVNKEAEDAGLTSRWCGCGQIASTAWRVAGREIWRCDDCGRPADADPPATDSRKPKKTAKAEKPVIKIDSEWKPGPAPEPSMEWWTAPVEGWAEKRLTIRNMATGLVTEIDLVGGSARQSKGE
jgi:hypothetical protein